MDDLGWMVGPFIIPIVAIIGWFIYAIVHSMHRTRIRELEIRERIAMIEKGMMPRPEVDPRGFDRAMYRHDRIMRMTAGNAGRHRRAGIVLIGVGVGLMFLIGFHGNPEEAFGVGGFLCILGLAFLVNSLFELRYQPPPPANGSTANHPGSPSGGSASSSR